MKYEDELRQLLRDREQVVEVLMFCGIAAIVIGLIAFAVTR